MSTAYHPQTDGLTERVYGVIDGTLRAFGNHRQSNWVHDYAAGSSSLEHFARAPTGTILIEVSEKGRLLRIMMTLQ